SRVYFDLATWHLINTVYAPGRVAELARMKSFYAEAHQHRRLMTLVAERLGHALIGQAEAAKIAVADGGHTTIDLDALEAGLQATLDDGQALAALDADIERIAAAADVTLAQAGVDRSRVDALYFTGGSTGLKPLAARIAARFPQARAMHGDRFASVAQGLGLHAQRLDSAR
ncbi:MAG: heat-shock protein, partial [Burkholderiaceae bacterium]|nr:heat-shock protein [Burkholderiaceae bacterium]